MLVCVVQPKSCCFFLLFKTLEKKSTKIKAIRRRKKSESQIKLSKYIIIMHHILRTDCALLHTTLIISILIVSLIVPSTNTFNLDTVNYIRHEGEAESMFGFSVALHKEQQRSW